MVDVSEKLFKTFKKHISNYRNSIDIFKIDKLSSIKDNDKNFSGTIFVITVGNHGLISIDDSFDLLTWGMTNPYILQRRNHIEI